LGAALAAEHGDGVYDLRLNQGAITVEGRSDGPSSFAALQSPPTQSQLAGAEDLQSALDLFSYASAELDPRLPPAFIEAGARHLVLALSSRTTLAEMNYDFEAGAALMRQWGLATVALIHAETASLFHARNAFAAGGVYEDPATGAAAAALAGYLRDLGWPHGGRVEIHQGDDMGVPCRLYAEIPPEQGSSIRVSGTVRAMSGLS
jgi:PhzF family phenazine biosynthesis protein